ncbi:DoxX family protein [Pseudochryseolinea flava]|uniref:DoxX family protein n=1 Tax=Pseudochryseolinea flava TaxID=2059302 RepID=A0A364YCP7_9BACT|nr:DoxX family protein [Pseudochryseolinea flava]RAW03448.1 DoxX family protein [Pseudochryseolinea flava]
MRKNIDTIFYEYSGWGNLLLRLLIGWRLIDGTQDNVFSWARMLEFRDFLAAHDVAAPLLAAVVSVYAQFILGIMYLLGAYIRWAAVVMIINFIAALLIAHIGTSFQESFQALTMLFGSIFFLLSGAGRISVDEWRLRQNKI